MELLLVNAGNRGRKKWVYCFIFRLEKETPLRSNSRLHTQTRQVLYHWNTPQPLHLFFQVWEKYFCRESEQVKGILPVEMQLNPLGHSTQSCLSPPRRLHSMGQKGCGKNKMRQKGWLPCLLRIGVSLEKLFKCELLPCHTNGLPKDFMFMWRYEK